MRYFRLAYKDNMTSTTHVEDVRADSKEDAVAKACGCGYPLTQVRGISLAERGVRFTPDAVMVLIVLWRFSA